MKATLTETFLFKNRMNAEYHNLRFRTFPQLIVSPIERVFIWYKFGYRYTFTVEQIFKIEYNS